MRSIGRFAFGFPFPPDVKAIGPVIRVAGPFANQHSTQAAFQSVIADGRYLLDDQRVRLKCFDLINCAVRIASLGCC